MQTVSVSELKAHLSRYLREVRRGGEVQVLDRGRPVARLTGLHVDDDAVLDAHRAHLIRSGTLRPGTGEVAAVVATPPVEVDADVTGAIIEERADRL